MTIQDDHELLSNKERYSFTLPPELIDQVDRVKGELEINRSMVVREALSHWLEHRIQEEDLQASGFSLFSYIYDHHDQNVISCIAKVRHDFEEEIISSSNFHVSHHRRLELNICKGDFGSLKELSKRLRQIKGISSFSENYMH